MKLIKRIVEVKKLRTGDTVEINGQLITVSRSNLKHCNFMGATFNGDPFIKGITKVQFKVSTNFGYRIE